MAKPVSAYLQLPSDAGNAGKQVRTQTRVVSGQTVHEHFNVRATSRTIEGVYFADPGLQTVQASAQNATSTGFMWLINPSGSTTNIGVRKVKFEHQVSSSTAMPTNPRIGLALATFTGTASGATVTIAKRASADASAQASVRTAVTGMTVTLGNLLFSTLPAAVVGTAGLTIMQSNVVEWKADMSSPDDEYDTIVLATGEQLVCYQPDSGTASDSRKFDLDVEWAEFDNS